MYCFEYSVLPKSHTFHKICLSHVQKKDICLVESCKHSLCIRYAVCQSTRPGTVRVWNVARMRFKGRPVQVEHGLFSSSDIALVRDLKLYILSDRGTINFPDTPTSVYQVLLCTAQTEESIQDPYLCWSVT